VEVLQERILAISSTNSATAERDGLRGAPFLRASYSIATPESFSSEGHRENSAAFLIGLFMQISAPPVHRTDANNCKKNQIKNFNDSPMSV
jgi:hypothetical protein